MNRTVKALLQVGPALLPFADAATPELPLPRLLRLALFQVSVGASLVLLNGTLNRVMIVELGIPAWVVATMVALPILFAPMRALVGFKSDNHRSALGWRRIPYLWKGTMIQFGGLAILPFALLVLSGRGEAAPRFLGEAGAAIAFLLIGAGLHTAQTAGVALATDLAPAASRPRVVALLYVMLLAGMVAASLTFGALLRNFSYMQLVRVIQGAAVATITLNLISMWKQEGRHTQQKTDDEPQQSFGDSLRAFLAGGDASRLLVVVGLGSAGFNMQDILLEPFGGEVLKLSVSSTTSLTALMAGGTLTGLFLAARWLSQGKDASRLAAIGALVGIGGFASLVVSAQLVSLPLFWAGTACVGFGNGWFAVGTLTSSMALSDRGQSGLAIGAWGAVQATVGGAGVALGGVLRDVLSSLARRGSLGPHFTSISVGYGFVYSLEMVLLVGTFLAMAPLLRKSGNAPAPARFGLPEFPT